MQQLKLTWDCEKFLWSANILSFKKCLIISNCYTNYNSTFELDSHQKHNVLCPDKIYCRQLYKVHVAFTDYYRILQGIEAEDIIQ